MTLPSRRRTSRPASGHLAVWVVLAALLSIPYPQRVCETTASASGAHSAPATAARCGGALYFALPGRGPAEVAPEGSASRLLEKISRALGVGAELPEFTRPLVGDPYFLSPRVRRILQDNAPHLLNRSDRFVGRGPSPLVTLPAEAPRRI